MSLDNNFVYNFLTIPVVIAAALVPITISLLLKQTSYRRKLQQTHTIHNSPECAMRDALGRHSATQPLGSQATCTAQVVNDVRLDCTCVHVHCVRGGQLEFVVAALRMFKSVVQAHQFSHISHTDVCVRACVCSRTVVCVTVIVLISCGILF